MLKYWEVFLKEMKKLESLMPTFVENNMIQINPEISDEKLLYILVTHDECVFNSNDPYKKFKYWKDMEMILKWYWHTEKILKKHI